MVPVVMDDFVGTVGPKHPSLTLWLEVLRIWTTKLVSHGSVELDTGSVVRAYPDRLAVAAPQAPRWLCLSRLHVWCGELIVGLVVV